MEILSPGSCSVGWALTDAGPDVSLGGDESSWAYDGSSEEKIFAGLRETYGKKWAVGDTVGVFLDTNDKTIGKQSVIAKLSCNSPLKRSANLNYNFINDCNVLDVFGEVQYLKQYFSLQNSLILSYAI